MTAMGTIKLVVLHVRPIIIMDDRARRIEYRRKGLRTG